MSTEGEPSETPLPTPCPDSQNTGKIGITTESEYDSDLLLFSDRCLEPNIAQASFETVTDACPRKRQLPCHLKDYVLPGYKGYTTSDQNVTKHKDGTSNLDLEPTREYESSLKFRDEISHTHRPSHSKSKSKHCGSGKHMHSKHACSRKSKTSSHSCSSSHTCKSAETDVSVLSEQQSVRLKCIQKQVRLNELRRQIDEEEYADEKLRNIDDAAYAAQLAAEEEIRKAQERAREIERKSLREREEIQTNLSRARRLREAEHESHEASLLDSMVNCSNAEPDANTLLQPVIDSTPRPKIPQITALPTQPLNPSVQVSVQTAVPTLPPGASPPRVLQPQPTPLYADSSLPSRDLVSTIPVLNLAPIPSSVVTAGSVRTPQAHHLQSLVDRPAEIYNRHPPTLPPCQPRECEVPPLPSMTELLISSSYGIPKPTLPTFSSGKERDFSILKIALDNLIDVHPHLTQQYKYQVLLGSLAGPPKTLAEAYLHDPNPYTSALRALKDKYGQPRQLVQSELAGIMSMPAVKVGDSDSFDRFALAVQSLVGMLQSLEGENVSELKCGSHVDRLMSKLPSANRDNFVEYCLNRGILRVDAEQTYSLIDFAEWLKTKALAKRISNQAASLYTQEAVPKFNKFEKRVYPFKQFDRPKQTTVFSTVESSPKDRFPLRNSPTARPNIVCAFCSDGHHISACREFKKLSVDSAGKWMLDKKRCLKCARAHRTELCDLQKPCLKCQGIHLSVLHDVVERFSNKILFVDQPSKPASIILKVLPVVLHGPAGSLKTYAILDDGSTRTMILDPTVNQLGLHRTRDTILLSTIRKGQFDCCGYSVDLHVSPASNPERMFSVNKAFTSDQISLSEYSYPTDALQERYPHLQDIPLPQITGIKPTILIGSDNVNLILPVKPIIFGPKETPVAVCTSLGWALQGPSAPTRNSSNMVCHLTSGQNDVTTDQLARSVERLWQIDTIPYQGKNVTRSKEDQQAVAMLEEKTVRVEIHGKQHYATPLLRRNGHDRFQAGKEAVMSTLHRIEKHHDRHPQTAEIHNEEIQKLVKSGAVTAISEEESEQSDESWFIPHHIVHHNGKNRLVFNCSFECQGMNLNRQLLPGPTLGSSLLGVLLRFRCHPVAVSGDIQAMFHQIRLQPKDQPLLRFVWRDMDRSVEPTIFQWRVLPFGTTCSPCCATFALMKHARDSDDPEVMRCVNEAFYVDNCLDSLPNVLQAKELVHNLRKVLSEGGFNIRCWASNIPEVIEDLPSDAKSSTFELWANLGQTDPNEAALGLHWNCETDELVYRYREVVHTGLTMKTVYQILASQYDPIGYLTPFTARAKIIVQDLWQSKRQWDDEIPEGTLTDHWKQWESELQHISEVHLPRCYTEPNFDSVDATRHLHIFSDASERIYGSVGYLRIVDHYGNVTVAFVAARSRVAPKKQLSMPRLELCAALSAAQLADTLCQELKLSINDVVLWSDSTTVLAWLQSNSCRFKVFVGTRITEIQSLTGSDNWRYTNGDPGDPYEPAEPSECELKKVFTGVINTADVPEIAKYSEYTSLLKDTKQDLDGAAAKDYVEDSYDEAEKHLLRQAQQESFPDELVALQTGKPVSSSSRLKELSPEYDPVDKLIRVGGRLRQAENIPENVKHPIVLDPKHPLTLLLTKDHDDKLHHYGTERLLAEIRRRFWILRGREAIKRHQRQCQKCQKLRASPKVPRMADLPPARLRLHKPAFYSTGVDCFGPLSVTSGRRREKRWGIIFKCLTTRAVYLDLLENMSCDAYLMAIRRFTSLRGKPYEILSDCGTNFKAGDRELTEAVQVMNPELAEKLKSERIRFRYNPLYAPHFGGTWEREIRSVKYGIQSILGNQAVPEPVLRTVLAEISSILNSKPLGYVSSDVADLDPVTPNSLLIGRPDASLPQVVYPKDELLGRRRWRQSQVLADQFWSRFVKCYLPSQQPRQKWHRDRRDLKCDDVVMIADPQMIRAQWPVGRVTETFPSSDGHVRTATVHVGGKDYTRSVSRLICLPELSDTEQ